MLEKKIEGMSFRIKGNLECRYPSFIPNNREDIYQYGCEFEFYLDDSIKDYKDVRESLIEDLYAITHADLLDSPSSLPSAKDCDLCMNIKPDASLTDMGNTGVEVSVPISSRDGIKHYIEHICLLIDKYGFTNGATGFHMHISTINTNGVNFDSYLYMLICDKEGLLSSWDEREGYSHNVMNIINKHIKINAKNIKTNKGPIWNIVDKENNRIEIRTIGGEDYHKESERITEEFFKYADIFNEVFRPNTEEKEKHRQIEVEHEKKLISTPSEIQEHFIALSGESNIFPKVKSLVFPSEEGDIDIELVQNIKK